MVAIALALAKAYPALVAATSTPATSAGYSTPQSESASASQTPGPSTTIPHHYEPTSTHHFRPPGNPLNDVPRLEHSDGSLDYPTQNEPYPESTVTKGIIKTYSMQVPVTAVSESSLSTPFVTITYSVDVVHLENSASGLAVPTENPAPGIAHAAPGEDNNPAPVPGYAQPIPPPESTEAVQPQPGAGSGTAPGNGPGDALLVPGPAAGSSAEAIAITDSSPASTPTMLVTTMPGSLTTINGQVFTAPPAVYTFTLAAGSGEGNGYGTGSGTAPSNSAETESSSSPSEAAGQAPTSDAGSNDSKVKEGAASRWRVPLMGMWLVTVGVLALI